MKILELTRSFYPSIGGMEKFVDDRLKIYEFLGHEYQVITTTHSEKRLDNSKKLDFVKYLPSYTPYEIVPSLKQTMNLDYDVLSINQVGYFYSEYAINRAYQEGKKIILTPHFHFHTDRYKLFKDLHFKYILPKSLYKVDKIICFTTHEANYWIKNFPFTEQNIEIIPHYFQPPKSKVTEFKNEYEDFILFLGRGERNKRVDLLLPAFDEIKSNYKLVLTIAKDELSDVNKNIVDRNKNIHILGRVSENEKQSLLATCKALTLPTDYEAFGIVNLEASHYSKPLLLSNLKVFHNIFDSKGVMYFENNSKSLKRKLSDFIKLSLEEKHMMGRVNSVNLKQFSFEVISHKYSQLLG